MAKGLFGMGGGQPRTTNNGSPGGIRPMPRPIPGAEAGAGQRGQGPLAGYLGPQGSERRADMAMEFLKAAMSSAGQSGSPILQLLTPLVGGVIGARTEKLREDRRAADANAMTESILGPNGLSPAAKRAAEVMNNENAPEYLRAIAKKQFDAAMAGQGAPAPARAGGGGGGSGGAGRPPRLTYIARDPDGVVRGYNPATGKREVVPNADAPAAAPAPGAPDPADPLGLRTPTQADPLDMP